MPAEPGLKDEPMSVLLALAVLLVLGALPGPLAAQSGSVPLGPDHWSYELLDALDAAGLANAWMSDVRPSSRALVRSELERVGAGAFGPDEVTRAWLRRFDGLHPLGSWEVGATVGARSGDALLDPGGGALALASAAADWGWGGAWLEAGRPARELLDDPVRSVGVGAPLGPLQVTAGRFRIKGTGPDPSSAQLGGAVPMDALQVASRRRAPLPALEWLFGPVAWHFALAPWAGAGEPDRGWIGLGAAVAEPHPDFRIGAVRTARFGGEQVAPFTAGRFLRTVFIRQNEPFNWDDQKIELTFRYRWELGGQPVAAHLVLGQEDPPPWRDPAILAGLTLPVVRPSGLWVLRYRYAAVGARARWCPACDFDVYTPGGAFARANWYGHSGHPDYVRSGVPVGLPLGGYGARHSATLRFWDPGARFRVAGWAFAEVREEGNRLYGRWPGKRRGGGMELLWLAHAPLEVELRAVAADGPRIEAEWGLEAAASWVGPRGAPGRQGPAPDARAEEARPSGAVRPPALSSLEPGARVEVWSPRLADRRARGRLRAVDSDTFAFAPAPDAVHRLPLGSLRRVRVAAGTRPATWRGALFGTVVGIASAIAWDEATGERADGGGGLVEPRWGLRAAIVGAGAGAGALVGRLVEVDAWREVELER